jgi:hypothetical protein
MATAIGNATNVRFGKSDLFIGSLSWGTYSSLRYLERARRSGQI